MGGRKKVLWVDDEIEFLRSHIMFLETRGYSVIPVFSGDDAIHLIQKDPKEFDIVLLDEQMPGKDGLTTLEEIKEMNPELPVVMVTKSEEEKVMEDALGKKIDGYLTKPVNPSQILLVCKRLLDSRQIISSQVKQRFVRSYSQNRTLLNGRLNTLGWVSLYENLARWDLELEGVDDEGLRQTHAGQKSDCNKIFSDFVIENYARWTQDEDEPPALSTQIIEKSLAPLIRKGGRAVFIVMSGMRVDHYLGIESVLRKYYNVNRSYYYSILPSCTTFTRPALFGGAFPSEIARSFPDLWKTGEEDESSISKFEQQLLAAKLKSLNLNLKHDPLYLNLNTVSEPRDIVQQIAGAPNEVIALVVNFSDLLNRNQNAGALLQTIANDENAYRSLTLSWFQHSVLHHVLKEIAQLKLNVILTADHGSILCSRGTEIYGVEELGGNLRFRFGDNITADERCVVNLSDPAHFKLPRFSENHNCIIAKENYYFIHPEKFEFYQKQYKNTFQHGGVSLEEVIIPLGWFTAL